MVIDAGRVVAAGTPAELAARVPSEHVVRFRTDRPVPAGVLEQVPSVTAVTGPGDDGRYRVDAGADVVQDLMVVLAGAGVRAGDLHVQHGSLEDAFVALTGHPTEV